MAGGAGAGAMAQASMYMRQVQRQLDMHLAKRAAMRAAMRDAIRRSARKGHVPPVPRAEHRCFHLCLECGHLADVAAERCPACGQVGLLDLSFDIAADHARELEAKDRHKKPLVPRILLASLLFGVTIAVGFLTTNPFLPVLASMTLAIPAYAVLIKPFSRLLRRPSLRRPTRWRGPLHPSTRPTSPALHAHGRVMAIDGLLSSPLTGRSCVAYEVAVKLRDPNSYRGGNWLLHETYGSAFAVGDVHIDEGRSALALPLCKVERQEVLKHCEMVERFLRERGLAFDDGALDFYEASLDEGVEAEVEVHTEPDLAIVGLKGTLGALGRRRGPYR